VDCPSWTSHKVHNINGFLRILRRKVAAPCLVLRTASLCASVDPLSRASLVILVTPAAHSFG
jgi:hypothetical protein